MDFENLKLTYTGPVTTGNEVCLLLQVLEGDAGINLKFVAKGESDAVDSPGDLYITVRILSWHAASFLPA